MASDAPVGSDPAPWHRSDGLALLAIVLLATASLAWLSHGWFDASNDAAIYVHAARALLAGEGYTWLGEPFIIRPPGFSVLLMPVLAARGVDFAALNLYVGLWGVLCAALFFVWARTRLSTWVALAVTALVWCNPGFAALRSQVMSDVPGTALLFGCLLLERWSARKPSLRRDIVLALAIGLSAYVRSICVLLLPAIALARLFERRETHLWTAVRTRVLPLLLFAALAQLPWSVRNAISHPEPPVDQTSLYDYSTGMWHTDRGDPASPRLPLSTIVARVPRHARDALVVLGSRMQASEARAPYLILGGAFVLVLVLGARRRRASPELFALAAIGLVLPYFSFQDRLLLPVLLIAWVSTAELLEQLGRKFLGVERAPLIALAPALALLAIDFQPRASWEAVRTEHDEYAGYCKRLEPLLPRDARVAVPIESWRYSIYLDRPVWTLFFGWNRGRGPAGAEAVIDRRRIDTVLLTPFTPSDASMRPYFVERYGTRHEEAGITLVKVR